MNVIPSRAVAISHARSFWCSPRWMAARASTMVRLLIRRTNELTDVYGMSYTWAGVGPEVLRPRYSREVEIRAPNSRHSEPRNAHTAILALESPVEVRCSSGTATVAAWAIVLPLALGRVAGLSGLDHLGL